uniref:Proline dehydrogenase domain-containing protein n=1 Tax=viral metagenome TaxID=1070528 RepID=A0A6C0ADG6_9ZZZZ
MFSRFIGGRSLTSLGRRIQKLKYKPIIDYVGEKGNFTKENKKCVSHFKYSFISLKPTGLGLPNIEKTYENCLDICKIAEKNNNKILIDAENYLSKEKINVITDELINEFNSKDNILVYKTIQAYYKDSVQDLEQFLSKHNNPGIKLVRGAYISEDNKYRVLCDTIEHTHINYNKGIELLSEFKKDKKTDIILATHNKKSCFIGKELDNLNNNKENRFKYAQLLGMADILSQELKDYGEDVYKYIPYGEYSKSIPYLTRRLIENYKIMQYLFT